MHRLKKMLLKLRDRYLFAILLTLLLPCVLVAAFVQSTYIRQMDSYILSAAGERTQRVQQEIDRIFDGINNVTDIVALDADLGGRLSPQDYSKVISIQDLLKTLRVNQRCIGNIVVLQEDGDLLVSARGTYQKDTFYSVYVPEGLTQEEFYEHIQKNGNGLITVRSVQGEYWLYVARFSQKKQNICLLFLLDKTELRQALGRHLDDGTGMLLVRDAAGTVLSLQTNDPDYSWERYEGILNRDGAEERPVTVEGKRYVVAKSGLSQFGWETVSVITGDSLSRHAQAQNNIWVLMLVIVLLVGVIMVIYLSNAMYKPIHSIKSKVDRIRTDRREEGEETGSVYETISAGIDYLQRESLHMRSQIESHKQYLIGRLLSDGLSSREDLEQLCSVFGWNRARDVFYVCLVRTAPGYSREELVELIQTVQMRQVRFLVKEMHQGGTFAVIWNTSRDDCAVIDEQLELVRTSDSGILEISQSSRWCSIEGVPEAFIRAIVATAAPDTVLPEEACRQLRGFIGNGSWAKAARILEGMAPQLEDPAKLRFLCLSVALSVPEDTEFSGDVFELAKITDPAFYRDYLKKAAAYIRENARRNEKNQEQELPLITKMIRYLSVKYNDPTFSIQEMADEFGMSMPALSKYFHEKHGVPLNEYNAQLKMERAKYLLENTDMSASAISQDVGYTNPGSFGRRFRQMTGMSPLEYRRRFIQNKEETTDG